jgi:hypothetical protein
MEKLIKEILNITYENSSEDNLMSNYMLFAKFVEYCKKQIPLLTDYKPTDVQLKVNEYSLEDDEINTISIDNSVLSVIDEQDLIVDLLSIASNVINRTQIENTITHTTVKPFATFLSYDESSFERILQQFALSVMNNENLQMEEKLPSKHKNPEDIIEKVKQYIYALIWSQPNNAECNEFAFSVINKLLTTADNMDLTEEERSQINILNEEFANLLSSNKNLIRNNRIMKESDDVREILQWFIRERINYLLKKDPNYIRRHMYIDSNEIDRRLVEDPFNLYDIICGLELNYNDTMAHEVLQTLLRNQNQNEYKDKLICQLVINTNITLTPEEEKKIRVIIERIFHDISFEDFIIEKNKLSEYKNEFMKKPSLVM